MAWINNEWILDLSIADKQFNRLSEAQVVGYNPLSQDTNFMLDQSVVSQRTLVVNDEGVYASNHSGKELLADLDGRCLHSHSQKERLLNKTLGYRYRYPLITQRGIFSPLDRHVMKSDVWLNIMQVICIKVGRDGTDCCVLFQNGDQVLLPKSLRAVKRSIRKDLIYSYLYFSFFERLVMQGGTLKLNYSNQILEKASELSIRIPVELDTKTYHDMKFQLEYIVTQDYFKRMGQPELLEEIDLLN